ncbi:MAG: twin-arginine translocase subunit TatC [Desulfobacteraceae bacterium]|nr:MAG: twin-arginine translocase subunit TatC [Desulfobacteraceae bacterium]
MSKTPAELEKKSESPEVPEETESGKMSFLEHLDELRKRILHIAAYLFGGFILCLFFREDIYSFLEAPILPYLPDKLVITKVQSGFLLYMKVAFIGGVFLTIPGTLFEVWKFIAPGLYRKEKRYVLPFLFFSVFLFLLGGAFCYHFVLPTTFGWLLDFARKFTPMIEATSYFDIVIMMLLGFGLIFEMPIVIAFLSLFGMVSSKFLLKNFKYAVLILVIIAALLSPTGDPVNLFIWSAPMILLFTVSIGVAFVIEKVKKKKASV